MEVRTCTWIFGLWEALEPVSPVLAHIAANPLPVWFRRKAEGYVKQEMGRSFPERKTTGFCLGANTTLLQHLAAYKLSHTLH
jgi:hypothetical protein